MSFLSVDSEYNNSDENDGQTNEDGDQEVHVQIEGNHSLNKLGVATCEDKAFFEISLICLLLNNLTVIH